MVVQKVFVPGYLISPTLLSSHITTPLSTFEQSLFLILCQAHHLETNPASAILSIAPHIDSDILAVESEPLGAPEQQMCNVNNTRFDPLLLDSPPFVLRHKSNLDAFLVMDSDTEQPISHSAIDPTTLTAISQVIIDVMQYKPQNQSLTCSRRCLSRQR